MNIAQPFLRIGLLVVLVSLLSGCAWLSRVNPFASDDGQQPAPLMAFEAEGRFEQVWRGNVGAGLGRRFNRLRPAVVGDRMFVADAYGLVEARDRQTGEVIWENRVDFPDGELLGALAFWYRADDRGSFVTGGVHADEHTVFIGTARGEFIALNADTGAELWRVALSSEVLAPAASDSERVFVVTGDGRLRALSRSDGRRVWSHDTQVPVLSLRGTAAPVVRDQFLFQGFANGRLTALRTDNGQVVWESGVGVPSGRSELERMADVDGEPLITPTGLYGVSYQGAVKSLRPQDGSTIWERPVSSYNPMAHGYGQIYVVDERGAIRAYDQNTGAVAWEQDGLLRRGVTGPAVAGAFVVVGDQDGFIHVFAQSDGRPITRTRLDRRGIRLAPLVVDDDLYVLGNSGRLTAYRITRD